MTQTEKKYFVVLHGAQSPGDEARLALRTALSAVLQFTTTDLNRIFSALPSVLQNDLGKEEAERLRLSVESLGGDCEILEQQDLFADDTGASPGTMSANTVIESGDPQHSPSDEFELSLAPVDVPKENDSLFEEESPAPGSELPAEDDFDLSLSLDDEPYRLPEKKEAVQNIEPEITKASLPFELEPDDSAVSDSPPTSSPQPSSIQPEVPPSLPITDVTLEVTEQLPHPAHEPASAVVDEKVSEISDSADSFPSNDTSTVSEEEDWRNTPVDWVPPNLERPLSRKKSSNALLWFACAVLLLGTLYLLFVPPAENNPRITLSIDQLLAEQQQLRARKKDPTTGRAESVPFDDQFSGEHIFSDTSLSLSLGQSRNGIEISSVVITSQPGPLPSKKEYMQGVRPKPWLRRFEVKRPVSTRIASQETSSVRDSVAGKIIVEKDGVPRTFVGTFTIDGNYSPERKTVIGEWRLSNTDLPDEFSDTFFIRELEGGRFEVIGKGAFEVQLVPRAVVPPRSSITPDLADPSPSDPEPSDPAEPPSLPLVE